MKIRDSKIHFFRYKHFFEETCRPNLIQNIILFGLKLFISRSGGSFNNLYSPGESGRGELPYEKIGDARPRTYVYK